MSDKSYDQFITEKACEINSLPSEERGERIHALLLSVWSEDDFEYEGQEHTPS